MDWSQRAFDKKDLDVDLHLDASEASIGCQEWTNARIDAHLCRVTND